jgi:hypothetical protein
MEPQVKLLPASSGMILFSFSNHFQRKEKAAAPAGFTFYAGLLPTQLAYNALDDG